MPNARLSPGTSATRRERREHEHARVADPLHAGPELGRALPLQAARAIVLAALTAAALLLAATAAFVALVNPYGQFGWTLFPVGTPRDAEAKAELARDLRRAPRVVVFGSSRSMSFNPADIAARTGLSTFNAGVRGGDTLDAWALANAIHDDFPRVRKRYVWLLDDSAFFRPRMDYALARADLLERYFPRRLRHDAATPSLWRVLSLTGVRDAYADLRQSLERGPPHRFRSDGRWAYLRALVTSGATPRIRVSRVVRGFRRLYATHPDFTPITRRYFERTLASINGWGERPLIVLSPIDPELLRVVRRAGWERNHARLLAYLHALHGRYRFRLVDETSARRFGASAADFADGTHMRQSGFHLLLADLLRRTHGALQ